MWVILRKTLCSVQRENPHATGMLISCRVDPCGFVGDLDEAVSRDSAVFAHLPEKGLLVVVDAPGAVQERGDDVLVPLLALEVDAAAEAEVGDVAGERADVVDGDVGLAGLALVPPVVAEIPGPVVGVAREARPVHFEFFVSQLDEAQRADGDGEVGCGGPHRGGDKRDGHGASPTGPGRRRWGRARAA